MTRRLRPVERNRRRLLSSNRELFTIEESGQFYVLREKRSMSVFGEAVAGPFAHDDPRFSPPEKYVLV